MLSLKNEALFTCKNAAKDTAGSIISANLPYPVILVDRVVVVGDLDPNVFRGIKIDQVLVTEHVVKV